MSKRDETKGMVAAYKQAADLLATFSDAVVAEQNGLDRDTLLRMTKAVSAMGNSAERRLASLDDQWWKGCSRGK